MVGIKVGVILGVVVGVGEGGGGNGGVYAVIIQRVANLLPRTQRANLIGLSVHSQRNRSTVSRKFA